MSSSFPGATQPIIRTRMQSQGWLQSCLSQPLFILWAQRVAVCVRQAVTSLVAPPSPQRGRIEGHTNADGLKPTSLSSPEAPVWALLSCLENGEKGPDSHGPHKAPPTPHLSAGPGTREERGVCVPGELVAMGAPRVPRLGSGPIVRCGLTQSSLLQSLAKKTLAYSCSPRILSSSCLASN